MLIAERFRSGVIHLRCYTNGIPLPFTFIPRSFPAPSMKTMNTLESFILSYALEKQTDRQTDRQMALNILPTPTDRVSVGNNYKHYTCIKISLKEKSITLIINVI